MNDSLQKKNQKIGIIVFLTIAFMLGLSFAAAPLYDLFCRVTGFGGTTQISSIAPDKIVERPIKVNFTTNTARNMPWKFGVELRSVKVNLGQEALINFKAMNQTKEPIMGTAIYNVTPLKAGKYFHKTQCFCFEQQILTPGQSMNMPVVFYIDPAMHEDQAMDDVSVITLSYTFFKSGSKDLEKALEKLGEG